MVEKFEFWLYPEPGIIVPTVVIIPPDIVKLTVAPIPGLPVIGTIYVPSVYPVPPEIIVTSSTPLSSRVIEILLNKLPKAVTIFLIVWW